MAKLPTKEELGKPSSPGRTGVVSIGVPSMQGAFGTGAGLQGLAAGIGDLGQSVYAFAAKKREENNATDVLNADAMFNKSRLELERSIQNDPANFSTAGQRYTDGIHKVALPNSAALIRDKETRATWTAKRQTDADDGLYRTYGWADKIDRENKITSIENSLDADAQIYKDPYQSNRERLASRDRIDKALLYGVESGLISQEKAEQLSNKYKRDTQKEFATALLEIEPKAVTKIVKGEQAFKDWIGDLEGSGDYGAMERGGLGFAGKYQFGGQRAQELGVWTPAPGYSWSNRSRGSKRKWVGTFNIPGFDDVKTIDDFLANPDAQEAVMDLHIAKMDEEIAQYGLDKYIGTTVSGVPVTREGLYAALHIRGAKGTASDFVDGRWQTDANGTSALTYMAAANNKNLLADMDSADRATYASKAEKEVVMNDTLIKIKNGEMTPSQVAQVVTDNNLDYYQIGRLDSAMGLRAKEEERIRWATNISDTSYIPDPTDSDAKNAMDAAYLGPDGSGHLRMLKRDQGFFDETVVPLVANKRMIPPRLEGTLRAMLQSSDPNTFAFALTSLDTLQKTAPEAFRNTMTTDTIGKLQRFRWRSDLQGATPQQIAEGMISEAADSTKAEALKRKTEEGQNEAKKMLKQLPGFWNMPEFTTFATGPMGRRMVGAMPGWMGPKMPEGQDKALLEQRFIEVYGAALAETGDHKEAIRLTIPVLKKEFDVSEASDGAIMRHPPENFAPDVAGKGWVKPQVEAKLAPLNLPAKRLQADDRTDAEIAAGFTPTWQVMVPGGGSAASEVDPSIRDTGEGWVPLTDPEDGSLIRLMISPTPRPSDFNWMGIEMQGPSVSPQASGGSLLDILGSLNLISSAYAEEGQPQGRIGLFIPTDELGGDGRWIKAKPPEGEAEDITAGDLLTSEYWLKAAQNVPQSYVDTVEGGAQFVGDPIGTLGGFAAMMATDEEFRSEVLEHYRNYLSVGGTAKNFQKDPVGTLFGLFGAGGILAKSAKLSKFGKGKTFKSSEGGASRIATTEQLLQGGGAGIQTAKKSGVYFTNDFIEPIRNKFAEIADEFDWDADNPGGTEIKRLWKKLDRDEPWTFKEIAGLARQLNQAGRVAGKQGYKDIQAMAGVMRGELTKRLDAIVDAKGEGMYHTADITPEAAAETLKQSNKVYRQGKLAEELETMLEQSDIESSYVSIGAGNRANQLRKRVKQKLLEETKHPGTTGLRPHEIQILKKINKGDYADWMNKAIVRIASPTVGAVIGTGLDMGAVGSAVGAAGAEAVRRGAQFILDERAVAKMQRFIDAVQADGSARLEALVGKKAYDKFVSTPAGDEAVRVWQASIGQKSFGAASVALAVALSTNQEEARAYLQRLMDLEKDLAKTNPDVKDEE